MNPKEFGIPYFVSQVVGGVTTLDGKLIGSLRALLFGPGELTRDWIRGARVRRLRPVQLFLLVNVVVFFIDQLWGLPGVGTTSAADAIDAWEQTMKRHAGELGLEYENYKRLFAAKSSSIARSTVFVLVPVTALLSFAFNFMKERRLGVHLAFGAHAVAFFLIVPDLLMMSVVMPRLRPMLDATSGSLRHLLYGGFAFSPVLIFGVWWSIATRRAFGTHMALVVFQLIAIPIAYLFVVFVGYQYLIFKLTMMALAD